ncbi:MAG TPA: DUF86 domain-containing protein [Dictyoglomaceae bacterium]|nr:DUF86 domain-containing protein [Dictyoglomaceae bacterium]HPU43640.1 DUF86 domain-containing protein [Dictyoglomaceae bacterium]
MTFDKSLIQENIIEFTKVISELEKYKDIPEEEFKQNLSIRWTIERGLLAGINIILDIANHILASKYKYYPSTYEEALKELQLRGVISKELYAKMKGMGSFRNVLAHEYIKIDPSKVYENYKKFLEFCPLFIEEISRLI